MPEIFQQARKALGSEAVLSIIGTAAQTEAMFNDLWDIIDRFEARFSRFLPDSELTHVNQLHGKTVPVSQAFYDLAQTAVALADQTGGLFNPLILPALQQSGYVSSWPQTNKGQHIMDYRGREVASADQIVLEEDSIKIPKGSALDFGGIGKGYLLDKLGDLLDQRGCEDYWLSLGGDIRCKGHDKDGNNWQVGIQAALEPEKVIGDLKVPAGHAWSIATSGVTKRKGADWHHIIDPRTAQPAETNILTATVLADTGVSADITAKCLVIVGSDTAEDIARKLDCKQFLLQVDRGQNTVGIVQWSP